MSAERPPEPVPPFDAARFTLRPIDRCAHGVSADQFAGTPGPGALASEFLDSLPDVLGARALRRLALAIAAARRREKPVLWGLGGHVIKVGVGPVLADLMDRGFVRALVLNGAAAIHDAEIAMVGSTSEDVAGGLLSGEYGTAEETATLFAQAARRAVERDLGLGTALSRTLAESGPPHAERSLLCRAAERDVPVTVHVAIGTDTVHMSGACRGDDVGAATHCDFLRLASLVEGLDEGVYVNVGSAVVLPEVFLKAVALVQNARRSPGGESPPLRITTGNLDMLRHYRPRANVLDRPAAIGYEIVGHHEVNLPLLRMAVLAAAGREGKDA